MMHNGFRAVILFGIVCAVFFVPAASRAGTQQAAEAGVSTIDIDALLSGKSGLADVSATLRAVPGRIKLTSAVLNETESETARRFLYALAEGVSFKPAFAAELRRIGELINEKVFGWAPNARPKVYQERRLVTYPDRQPVKSARIYAIPILMPKPHKEGEPDYFMAVHFDHATRPDDLNLSEARKAIVSWDTSAEIKNRYEFGGLVNVMQKGVLGLLIPGSDIIRKNISDFMPAAADLFDVQSKDAYQPGGTTGEARRALLWGLMREPAGKTPEERKWEDRLVISAGRGSVATALAQRTLSFVDQESDALLALYRQNIPITMMAIGPYDGKDHEFLAIQKAAETLPADERPAFLKRIRVYFFDPDEVGNQLARFHANQNGIQLMPKPDLDPTNPEHADRIATFVESERNQWKREFPDLAPGHIRVTFVGSSGEYQWGNLDKMLPIFSTSGIDAIHGSFYKDTKLTQLLQNAGKKDWVVRSTVLEIIKAIEKGGFEPTRVSSHDLMPYVTIEGARTGECSKTPMGAQ